MPDEIEAPEAEPLSSRAPELVVDEMGILVDASLDHRPHGTARDIVLGSLSLLVTVS